MRDTSATFGPFRALLRGGVIALALLIGGCGSSVPRDNYYRLAPLGEMPARAGGPLPGTVEVEPFRAPGLLGDRAILFRDSATVVTPYSYHFWWTSPSTLIEDSAVEALQAAHAFDRVVTPYLRLDRDYELDGRILRFEQDRTAGRVSVAIELVLHAARSDEPLLFKTYTEEVPTASPSVLDAVAAFSTALDHIWRRLVADLGEIHPTPPAR